MSLAATIEILTAMAICLFFLRSSFVNMTLSLRCNHVVAGQLRMPLVIRRAGVVDVPAGLGLDAAGCEAG